MTDPTPHPEIPGPAERQALNAALTATGADTGLLGRTRPPRALAGRHQRMDTAHQRIHAHRIRRTTLLTTA
jgi:hypothetical protein